MSKSYLYRIIVKSPEDFTIERLIKGEVSILRKDRLINADRYYVSASPKEISKIRKLRKRFKNTSIIIKRMKTKKIHFA